MQVRHTGLGDVGREITGPVVGDALDLPKQVLENVLRLSGLDLA